MLVLSNKITIGMSSVVYLKCQDVVQSSAPVHANRAAPTRAQSAAPLFLQWKDCRRCLYLLLPVDQ